MSHKITYSWDNLPDYSLDMLCALDMFGYRCMLCALEIDSSELVIDNYAYFNQYL